MLTPKGEELHCKLPRLGVKLHFLQCQIFRLKHTFLAFTKSVSVYVLRGINMIKEISMFMLQIG